MKTSRSAPKKAAANDTIALRPVEVRYGFQAQLPGGEDLGFNITVGLLKGKLDLRVSLRGQQTEHEFLPLGLFEQVQEAASWVANRLSPDDLVEHQD